MNRTDELKALLELAASRSTFRPPTVGVSIVETPLAFHRRMQRARGPGFAPPVIPYDNRGFSSSSIGGREEHVSSPNGGRSVVGSFSVSGFITNLISPSNAAAATEEEGSASCPNRSDNANPYSNPDLDFSDLDAYEELILQAKEQLKGIVELERRLARAFDGYVGRHRFLPNKDSNNYHTSSSSSSSSSGGGGDRNLSEDSGTFPSTDVDSLDSDIERCFMAFFTGFKRIRELLNDADSKNNKNSNSNSKSALQFRTGVTGKQRRAFCENVEKYLSQRFDKSVKLYERMKESKKRLNANPFRLISSQNYRQKMASRVPYKPDFRKSFSLQTAYNDESGREVSSQSVVEKYEKEAIPQGKIAEYKSHISTYLENKNKLLEGADQRLISKVDEQDGVYEAVSIERKVEDVCRLYSQFASMIDAQSEQIDDLYDTSSTTLDNAHSGEQQLVETVERSEKTRYHILVFATSLAVLLLALDVMTP